jgi:hypothetical protein
VKNVKEINNFKIFDKNDSNYSTGRGQERRHPGALGCGPGPPGRGAVARLSAAQRRATSPGQHQSVGEFLRFLKLKKNL